MRNDRLLATAVPAILSAHGVEHRSVGCTCKQSRFESLRRYDLKLPAALQQLAAICPQWHTR
eukprot:2924467-Prymnesium_polylepis.2